jgi:hypothetical protein
MKLLFTMPRFGETPAENIASIIDEFDPSFSDRYKKVSDLGELGLSVDLRGEHFWDADKYHLFFIDCDSTKVGEFVENMKSHDLCDYISPADDNYNACNDVLYVSEDTLKTCKRMKESFAIPVIVAQRTSNFKPR